MIRGPAHEKSVKDANHKKPKPISNLDFKFLQCLLSLLHCL